MGIHLLYTILLEQNEKNVKFFVLVGSQYVLVPAYYLTFGLTDFVFNFSS